MTTKQQTNKKKLQEMLNICIDLREKQGNLIESDYHFDSLCSQIVDKICHLEISILDCINDLNDAI